jgi:hypothetical protein
MTDALTLGIAEQRQENEMPDPTEQTEAPESVVETQAVSESTQAPASPPKVPIPPTPADVEAKVAARLAALDQDSEPEPEPEADDVEVESELDEETPVDDGVVETPDEEVTQGAEPPVTPKPSASGPTLPDSYRRSLRAYGWTDDEINTNLQALGAKFIDTAERLHSNRNQEVNAWAEAGRQKLAAERQPQGQPQPQAGPTSLKPLDTKELKKKYGDDDLIDEIVGPVNATIAAINSILPQLEQGRQVVANSQYEQAVKVVDSFFQSKDLATYAPFYGDTKVGVNQEQLAARNQVLDTAYALMTGAATVQGRQIPLEEAMILAHDVVAKDFKETAIRAKVKSQVVTRSRAVGLKPTAKTKPAATGPAKGEDLEKKVGQKLASLFRS